MSALIETQRTISAVEGGITPDGNTSEKRAFAKSGAPWGGNIHPLGPE